MSSKVPRLLLFDIDGTLTKSAYNKLGVSYICTALSFGFEREVKKNDVIFDGGTDGSISADLLKQYDVTKENCPDYDERILKSFSEMPRIMHEGIKENHFAWKILPNTNELLSELAKRSDVKIALLTGNHRDTAVIKLENAGVDTSHFRWGQHGGHEEALFGAFGGSDNPVRDRLVDVARQRYEAYLGGGVRVGPNDMVIIGDSPKDVSCAHNNGVPCVAVDTGRYSADQLSNAEAVLRGGFVDVSKAVDAIVGVQRAQLPAAEIGN